MIFEEEEFYGFSAIPNRDGEGPNGFAKKNSGVMHLLSCLTAKIRKHGKKQTQI